MYHPAFLAHFQHPHGQGALEDATHHGAAEDAACGDRLALDLEVREGTVRDARFRVAGCAGAIAVGSALVTLLPGRPAAVTAVTREDLERELGEVPRAKRHALRLGVAALAAALNAR